MKSILLLAAISAVLGETCPDGIRVRKDYRDLTTAEWTAYKSAVQKLYETGRINQYTSDHIQYSRDAHG